MFDFIRRIFCCGRKNQPPICSPFLALKKLLFPLSYRVAWDDGCPVTTQANVRSWSRKKTELTCPKSLTNALRKAPRRTKKCSGQSVACEENQGEKKKLTLEELKKLTLLDIKSSKPLLDQKIWTKKLLFNCGRIFSNLWTFLKFRKLLI